MKDITRTRLQLIIAKSQLLLAETNPWHQDAQSAITEIVQEAKKAEYEIRDDDAWRNGDR